MIKQEDQQISREIVDQIIRERFNEIAKDLNRELLEIKRQLFDLGFKLDADFRYDISSGNHTYENYMQRLDNQRSYIAALRQVLAIPALKDRVSTAIDLNKNLVYKLYADDIQIIDQVELTGGMSREIAELIKNSGLPTSERFQLFLAKFL